MTPPACQPASARGPHVSRAEQAQRAARGVHANTREALAELLRDALGAKIAVDVDQPDTALHHLDRIATNLEPLRATITNQRAITSTQDTQP